MHISAESGDLRDRKTNLMAVGIFEQSPKAGRSVSGLDPEIGNIIADALATKDLSGSLNQVQLFYSHGEITPKRVLMVGLGKKSELDLDSVRQAAGRIAQTVKNLSVSEFSSCLLGEGSSHSPDGLAQAMVEGTMLAQYKFQKFRNAPSDHISSIEKLTIMVRKKSLLARARKGALDGKHIAEAVCLSRDLANTPGNRMTPTRLAEECRKLSRLHGLNLKVFGNNQLIKFGMGGILGVARGSSESPQLIVLEYRGASESSCPPIALVGKGITFDAGGISLKPSGKMEEMKFDKSGAASVIAATVAAATLKLKVNLVCIVPATENLPGGSAQKPGDIIRHYGGKTSEVLNTDAEGRLILGDGIAYSLEYKPQAIIDLATLTGACIVALGSVTAGLFSNHDGLVRRIEESAKATSERVWRLPVGDEYSDLIKSEAADMKNVFSSSPGGPAGAIIAAMYLREFVGDVPWAHLDIAGTAWTKSDSIERTYIPKGATGYGVRLLVHLLKGWSVGLGAEP